MPDDLDELRTGLKKEVQIQLCKILEVSSVIIL